MSSCFPGQVNLISKVDAVKSIDPTVRSETNGCLIRERTKNYSSTFEAVTFWGWVQVVEVNSICWKNAYEAACLKEAITDVQLLDSFQNCCNRPGLWQRSQWAANHCQAPRLSFHSRKAYYQPARPYVSFLSRSCHLHLPLSWRCFVHGGLLFRWSL